MSIRRRRSASSLADQGPLRVCCDKGEAVEGEIVAGIYNIDENRNISVKLEDILHRGRAKDKGDR